MSDCKCLSGKNSVLIFKKVRDVKTPNRGTKGSAGIDFFIPNDWNNGKNYLMAPNENILIPSGIHVFIPDGYALVAFNKSGIAVKKSLIVGACVVDQDYEQEVHINLINTSDKNVEIEPGMKIIQFILLPVNYAEVLECTKEEYNRLHDERGKTRVGGFGSTGIK